MPITAGIASCAGRYYHNSMTTITCKIPERLDEELEALARRNRVSKSAVVRQALEQQIRRTRKQSVPNAFDKIKSLSGSLRGPADLSSNPRHLEGFGG